MRNATLLPDRSWLSWFFLTCWRCEAGQSYSKRTTRNAYLWWHL